MAKQDKKGATQAGETQTGVATIKQANRLILGRQTISLQAKRLLYFMAKQIDENSPDPRQVFASWNDFKDFVQVREPKNWRGRKRILRQIFDNLNDNPVELETLNEKGTKKYILLNWVQSIELDEDMERLEMYFSDKLISFLLYLKGQPYTKTIYQVGNYKSTFTIRIKEILEVEKWKGQSHYDITLERLKWMLGVSDKYPRYSDFRRFVLDKAQKELKQTNSPVQFTYTPLNKHARPTKRGIHSIRFYPLFIEVANEPKSKKTAKEAAKEAAKEITKKTTKPNAKPITQPRPSPQTDNLQTDNAPIDPTEAAHQQATYQQQHPALFKRLQGWGLVVNLINDFIQKQGINEVQRAIRFVEQHQNTQNPAGLFIRAMQNGWQTEAQRIHTQQRQAQDQQQRLDRLEKEYQTRQQQIKSTYAKEVRRVCDSIIAENPALLDVFYNMAKKHLQQSGKKVRLLLEDTAEKTYQSKMKRYAIMEQIQQTYPEKFIPLQQTKQRDLTAAQQAYETKKTGIAP